MKEESEDSAMDITAHSLVGIALGMMGMHHALGVLKDKRATDKNKKWCMDSMEWNMCRIYEYLHKIAIDQGLESLMYGEEIGKFDPGEHNIEK